MADKQEIRNLKQDIKKLSSELNKKTSNLEKLNEKLLALQIEIEENQSGIKAIESTISEKEELLKKATYSDVLNKLNDATLSSLSVRQTELLIDKILSGKIPLDEEVTESH